MTLRYRESEQWEMLLPILEDHTEWFHALVQCFFYPEEATILQSIQRPTSFAEWMVHANNEEGGMPPEIIEKLAALHSDLFKMADTLVFALKETGMQPSYADFQKFLTIFEEFILYVRRIEKDLLVEGSGFDTFTGLRNKNVFYKDVQRELDRLERSGKAFCVALVVIDDFDKIISSSSQDEGNGYLKLVSGLIKLSIRSFDDAYFMGNNEFMLCLKQADVSGGISALERLRQELEQQNVMVHLKDGTEKPLSVSCCIAEPMSGDNVKDLVKNLKADLVKSVKKEEDAVLRYHELSPLQRFVQEGVAE